MPQQIACKNNLNHTKTTIISVATVLPYPPEVETVNYAPPLPLTFRMGLGGDQLPQGCLHAVSTCRFLWRLLGHGRLLLLAVTMKVVALTSYPNVGPNLLYPTYSYSYCKARGAEESQCPT